MDLRTLWVSQDELKSLWEALHEYRFNTEEQRTYVESLLTECGVAETRAQTLYPAYERLAVSLGKKDGAVPLKLSNTEFLFLEELPLTQDLKEILH